MWKNWVQPDGPQVTKIMRRKNAIDMPAKARIWTGHTHNFNAYWNIPRDTAPLS